MRSLRLFVLLSLLGIWVAVPAPSVLAHDEGCTGVAPVLVECSSGEHILRGEFIQHGPDLDASSLYTGTIVSYLVSGSGNVKRTCHIVFGELDRCFTDDFSVWPKVGESFVHLCFSYFLETEDRGGIGPWGCFVRHD